MSVSPTKRYTQKKKEGPICSPPLPSSQCWYPLTYGHTSQQQRGAPPWVTDGQHKLRSECICCSYSPSCYWNEWINKNDWVSFGISTQTKRQCNTYVNMLCQVALLIMTGYVCTSWGVLGLRGKKWPCSDFQNSPCAGFFPCEPQGHRPHTLLLLLIATHLTCDRKKKEKIIIITLIHDFYYIPYNMAGSISWHYVLKFIITGPFTTQVSIHRKLTAPPPFPPSRRCSGWEVIAADPSCVRSMAVHWSWLQVFEPQCSFGSMWCIWSWSRTGIWTLISGTLLCHCIEWGQQTPFT